METRRARRGRFRTGGVRGITAAIVFIAACARDYEFRPAFDTSVGDATDSFVAHPDARDAVATDARDVVAADARDAVATDARDAARDTGDACSTQCNGVCTDLQTDDQHCGACGTVCTAIANGVSHCVSGACVPTCATGFHPCGSGASAVCAAANDPLHCGTSCSVCPTNQCNNGACEIACSGGTHVCGDHCASNSSVSECGTACVACAAPQNGSVACSGGACVPSCDTGMNLCPGSSPGTQICADAFDATACGPSCTQCAAPSNGSPVCVNNNCDFTCNAGFHRCGAGCYADDDATHCGSSCAGCLTPAFATAVCTNGTCDSVCNAGYHACGAGSNVSCESDSDPMHCGVGAACAACATPTGGSVACTMNGSTCAPVCPAGTAPNAAGTACLAPDDCSDAVAVDVPPGGMVTIDSSFTGASNDNAPSGVCGSAGQGPAGPDRVYQVTVGGGKTLTAVLTSTGRDFYPKLYVTLPCASTTPLTCFYANPGVYSATVMITAGGGGATYFVWADSGQVFQPTSRFTLTLSSN